MQFFPYIQQQYFNLGHILPETKGFAAFIDIHNPDNEIIAHFQSPQATIPLNEIVQRESWGISPLISN